MPAEKGVKTPRTSFLQRLSDAAYALHHMQWPEVQALFASAQLRSALPTRNKRKRDEDTKMAWPAKGRMWQVFNGLPDQPFGDMQPQPKVPAADRPAGSAAAAAHRARENRRDAAKRALEDMLSTGSAAPVASRLPGTKQKNRKPILDRMVNVIHGGVVTAPDGVTLMARSEWPLDEDNPIPPPAERIFRGLGECELLSDAFAEDRASLNIKTQRWLWHILQKHDPRLDVFSMRAKLEREDEAAMRYAQAGIGIVPHIRHAGSSISRSLFQSEGAAQCRWSEDIFTETFFCDAGKIDPAAMNLYPKGIGIRGEPRPAVKSKMTAIKHGRFPFLQFYCSLHKTFGVMTWLVHTGSNGGKTTLDPWAGVEFWTVKLAPWERQMIVDLKYFNRPEAVAAAEARDPHFFDGPFDPTKFLKANGDPAEALVASEIAALLIMAMLPYFRRCYKQSLTEHEFALRCRYYERCLGLPLLSVQNPFTISMDNARTHPESRKMASYMWQEDLDARAAWVAAREQLAKVRHTVDAAIARAHARDAAAAAQQAQQQQSGQQSGARELHLPTHDPQVLQAMDSQAAKSTQLQLPAVAPLQDAPTDAYKNYAELMTALSRAPPDGEATQLSQWARATVKAEPDGEAMLAELARRVQAYDDICNADPTACGYASQQFLPLADKTPDINSGAENCVFFHKSYVSKAVLDWMLDADMDDDLELAATYWDKCNERTAWLNSRDGLVTCQATVINALARVKMISTPKNEQVTVTKATVKKPENGPYSIVLHEAEVDGSGGAWIAQGVYSG